ncbi:MAG: hypothetical protein QOD99_3007 [Chthoniobacter sp.]|jgi:uncharacterized protein YkwD|nr:hypothetical protein [Chthoniobacter sp.]
MKLSLSLLVAACLANVALANEVPLEVLEEINLARTCPRQYAQLLAERTSGSRNSETRKATAEAVAFLNKVKPLPPLDFSDGLMLGAQAHVNDQGARGTTGHSGSDHSSPFNRMEKFGHWLGTAGENISYGYSDAKKIVATLIVDAGVPGRGHRKNIFSSNFAVAGVAAGKHARFGSMCVIDFAGGFSGSGDAKIASASGNVGQWSAFDGLRAH